MDIAARNQDIVSRHVAGETLSSIGAIYGVSRQRAKQLFDANATEADRARMAEPAPPPPKGDFPKGETRRKVHVPAAKSTDINQKQIRAGVRRWLAKEFDIELNAKGATRIDLVLAEGMYCDLLARADNENIPLASAVRGIIAYLEKEQAK